MPGAVRKSLKSPDSGSNTCPVCRAIAKEHLPAVHDSISLKAFSIYRCASCGLGATQPKPKNLDAFYAVRYYGNRHWRTSHYCVWRRLRVVRLLSGRDRGRLLDVGCGDGQFAAAARRAGWSVFGTELNDGGAVERRVPLYSSLEQATGAFQCITLWHVLEHMPDPLSTIRLLRSMIAPGGALVLSVPNFSGWQARMFGKHWFHLDVPRHCHHFDAASLKVLLEAGGFSVVRRWHHELEYDWFGWIQSALNPFTSVPSVLFDGLTGKPRRVSKRELICSYLGAAVLAPITFLLTVMSTLVRSGGTIIVAARPRPDHFV